MRRKSSLPLPRYVAPESVDVGDTIRVTWTVGDIELSRTAKVGAIHDEIGFGRTKTFITPNGDELVRLTAGSKKMRFTLIAEAPVTPAVPLFEMEDA